MANTTHNRFPTWMIVISILILAGPIIWGLAMIFDIVTAMSIGGVLVVGALVALFIWLKGRMGD
jgi:hypothetical protein